jgi:serine/threonine-protein kinase
MAPADRDLLFGLLALQNGLIEQGQLVAAFQAWTRDRTRPLAEHLVARGDLDADGRAGVQAMVALHLKKHGGATEQSLAAIPAARSIRASLAGIGDAEIGASIGHLAGGSTRACNHSDVTASYSLGTATSLGQRFQILRPHARGGLGAVFLAHDNELHREVALKQILDQYADDPVSRQRFVIEAEVTGGLEHPGIVPVYGLGTDGDGRPFYAMRFVRGDSLKEAIERFHQGASRQRRLPDAGEVRAGMGRSARESSRDLELRKLLRRFLDVCNAIDYAHSRGVLHRDIKPANVIMGRFGETLVVDWGLAKATGHSEPGAGERTLVPSAASGSAETLPGSALGTPAYMSPEQAEGDLARLGPRSDVYSLGATLYCLLVGEPPFAGNDLGEILPAVQRGEFRPPRMLDPRIDRALEVICLKAIALRPDDRYATPRALAEDVERWMADEPVDGWVEPFSRRTRRWARRHRTAVTAAAVALVVALAGTATVLAVQTRANGELRAANRQTLKERDLARQNFDLARRAVDDYLTHVGQNPLLKEHGLHEVRQELLEAALRYYREFLRQRGDDPSLTVDAAAAHERVGDIMIDLGRAGDALTAYDRGLSLIAPRYRNRLGDGRVAIARVRLEAGRLQALRELGSYTELIAAFGNVASFGEELLAAQAHSEELAEILARTWMNAAFAFGQAGRVGDASVANRRARALAERATRESPDDARAARTLVWVSGLETELLQAVGQLDEAGHLAERIIAFGRNRVHEHPRDVEMRLHLAPLEFRLGAIEKEQGRSLEALKIIRNAAASVGALARENPLLLRARSHWGTMLNYISQLETDLRRYAEAEQSARASIDLFETLVREVPSNPFYRKGVGSGYASLGKVYVKAGSPKAGLETMRKAVALLEPSNAYAGDPYNLACTLALASTVSHPAEGPAAVDRRGRDADRAVATIRRMIEAGYKNLSALKADPDFDSLRARPDFQALLLDLAMPADTFAPSRDPKTRVAGESE